MGAFVAEAPLQSVSELLSRWRAGDEESLSRLVPLVYKTLHRLAHHHLRQERPGHTLQTTALVNEAYLCLAQQQPMDFENRAHFFAVCAHVMREVLVQYARRRKAGKRGGGLYNIELDHAFQIADRRSVNLIALDDALVELGRLDPDQLRIVELRFFGGLSIEETAGVLRVSPATVKRHWATARVWLHNEISRTGRHDS